MHIESFEFLCGNSAIVGLQCVDGVGGSRARQVVGCVPCTGVVGVKEGAYMMREVGSVLEVSPVNESIISLLIGEVFTPS